MLIRYNLADGVRHTLQILKTGGNDNDPLKLWVDGVFAATAPGGGDGIPYADSRSEPPTRRFP